MGVFPWRRSALHRKVVINLKTGRAVIGVLWAKRGPLLLVKDASIIEASAGARPVSADGEVLVERANVDFMQILSET